jgi:formate-dependent nitrite reductase membrane component NrfD
MSITSRHEIEMNSRRYEQHLADLRSAYRPQREWGEGKGILLVIGHFLVGVAGGTWLMASFYGVHSGLVVAYVLAALGGIVHLMFLGRPSRAFKMIRHVRTSWISRGFLGLSVFLIGATLYLGTLFLFPPGALAAVAWSGKALAAIGTVIIIGYMGFCYTASRAIPFWHSSLHPVIYCSFAIRGGIASLLVLAAFGASVMEEGLTQIWVIVTALICVLYALELHGAFSGGNTVARRSVNDLVAGRLALIFYGGTLIIGLIVPVLLLYGPASPSPPVMAAIGLASAIGDFFMKLSTVRAGIYLPLHVPHKRHAH